MDLNLKNKTAIVCGSSQGIGKAAAIELSKMGANLVLIARNEESLKQTINELDASHGQKHKFLCADFSKPDLLREKINTFIKANGTAHILVNNTGGPPGGLITNAKPDDFLNTFNNHLICSHILMQAVIEGMKADKYGRIINVISTSVKQPLKGLGVSNTVRAAVANWAKTLANEVAGYGITVNNILPGATNTQRLRSLIEAKSERTGEPVSEIINEMENEIPAGRFAEAHEIAAAITFLASPAAAYITGINLPVDGGRTGCL